MRVRALLLILALGGCISSKGYTPTRQYTLEPEFDVAAVGATELSVGLRGPDAKEPFDKSKIWYREAPHELDSYMHAEWAEPPRDVAARELLNALVATGVFKDVGDSRHLSFSDLMLTGELLSLIEDRSASPKQATCELRLVLRTTNDGTLVWRDTITASQPIEGDGIPAFAAAAGKAMGTVLTQAADAIAAAVTGASAEGKVSAGGPPQ